MTIMDIISLRAVKHTVMIKTSARRLFRTVLRSKQIAPHARKQVSLDESPASLEPFSCIDK